MHPWCKGNAIARRQHAIIVRPTRALCYLGAEPSALTRYRAYSAGSCLRSASEIRFVAYPLQYFRVADASSSCWPRWWFSFYGSSQRESRYYAGGLPPNGVPVAAR